MNNIQARKRMRKQNDSVLYLSHNLDIIYISQLNHFVRDAAKIRFLTGFFLIQQWCLFAWDTMAKWQEIYSLPTIAFLIFFSNVNKFKKKGLYFLLSTHLSYLFFYYMCCFYCNSIYFYHIYNSYSFIGIKVLYK